MISGVSAISGGYRPQVTSGASMRQAPAQRMTNLFNTIDTSGSGSITKAQFEQAFQSMNPPQGLQSMGADAVWNQLDPNNTGSVSKQDFVSTMTNVLSQMHAQHASAATGAGGVAGGGGTVASTGSTQAGGRGTYDLIAALQNLEATLGGQSSSPQTGTTGSLFNTRA